MNRLIPFLLLMLIFFECKGQNDTIPDFKKIINQEWKRKDPEIIKTKPSFFNNENKDTYLIFEVKFDSESRPFSWDCDLSILNKLTIEYSNFVTEKKSKIYNSNTKIDGTIVKWNEDISSLIWTKEKTYKTEIKNWQLFKYLDCPGTISFPILRFEKTFELPNPRTNTQKGIAILPFDKSLDKINQSEIELLTIENNILKGFGYDINNDKINDIFIYYQELDEEGFTGYRRLYINVNGKWTCKWIEYYEECI